MLFLGKHDYSMDERGRVPMPPRFREALMQGIILTRGTPDRCIRAFPQDAFEAQAALFTASPVTMREGRISRRSYFGNAYPAELDKQGRVLIPPVLRQYAELDGQVIVLGTGEGFEIWSATDFESAFEEEEAEFRLSLESEN
jgi:MraZ protein